ncbi:MAG TPA: hypothetical protein VF601_24065 [Beijerinckiaceae bacterium]|jgi:hypothetical protein
MKRSRHVILLVVPALVAAIGLYSMRLILPVYVGNNIYGYDPAYVYLLNGVSIFLGLPPAHIDHPGTPAQVVTAVVAGLWWSLFEQIPGSLLDAAVADPEKYVRVMGIFFLGCNVVANWFLGHRVSVAAASLPVGVVAQTGPLFLGLLAPHLAYLAPEAMLLALAMVILGLLSGAMFRPESNGPRLGASLAAGALGGVGLATKVTFAPMLAILFVIPRDRRLLACLLAAFVAVIVSLLPVYDYAGAIVRWFLALATHKGRYGVGERGIVDVPVIVAQLKKTWEAVPIIYIGLLAAAAASLLHFGRVSLAVFVAFALTFCLALKPTQPHYFISIVPLSAVVLAWLLSAARAGARLSSSLTVLAICLGGLWSGVTLHALKAERAARSAEVRELEKIIIRYPGARIIGAYPVPEWTYALNFALGYTSFPFRLEASVKIPSDISYHLGGSLVWVSAGYGPIRFLTPYLAAGRPILLVFPSQIPFDRFECEEPVWSSETLHVCRVLKVLDQE